ncbi:LEAF RUST 10 DISEASE-RESISTANCE LOCUS RECEPTOR-LIKE PROTEIN KINASE-like 2.3 [Bienertia sinuspersici]
MVPNITDDFILKLSEGGFTIVYKEEELINEVASISRIKHVNISFDTRLHVQWYLEKYAYHGTREQELTLETTLNIIMGIAIGMDYIQRGCNTRIFYIDIKPHNILLMKNIVKRHQILA